MNPLAAPDLVRTEDGYRRELIQSTEYVQAFLALRKRILEAGCNQTKGDGEGYHAQQDAGELAGLIATLKPYEPFVEMLDIGIGSGGTTRLLAELLDVGHITTIDNMSHESCVDWERNKAALTVPVTEIQGDSKSPEVWAALRSGGKTFDLIGIDGMHLTDYVLNDLNLAIGQTRPGTIIWFHDINLPDVAVVWKQVARHNPVIYSCGPKENSLGIGAIVYIGNQVGRSL